MTVLGDRPCINTGLKDKAAHRKVGRSAGRQVGRSEEAQQVKESTTHSIAAVLRPPGGKRPGRTAV
ncbi:hypothetical protein [Streptomyces sp. NPDC057253]|uniref:hypothetical protein n=1 Tax=Streptomyces sp. NPDC057253 TaxID=3346069 RepID=UPI003634D645